MNSMCLPENENLEAKIITALKNVYDPEIPVNIYDLGLIYAIEISESALVKINMTLTSPGCPVAQTFPDVVAHAVKEIEGVQDVEVLIVWDPPWTQELMSPIARMQLGW